MAGIVPDDVTNRLGWLLLPVSMDEYTDTIIKFSDEIKNQGFRDVLLLGMGGSSLAPEFFEKTFSGKLKLNIIDTTDPDYISDIKNSVDPENTLIVISTKSGTTVETISLMKYFYHKFLKVLGDERAGQSFRGGN